MKVRQGGGPLGRFVVLAGLLALIGTGGTAFAQDQGRPGQAGLGSGSAGLVGPGQFLDLGAGLSAGLERLSSDVQVATGPSPNGQTGYGVGNASLVYGLNRGWLGADASVGSTAARWFSAQGGNVLVTHYGSGGVFLNGSLSRRTKISGNLAASYQPLSATTLVPGLGATGAGTGVGTGAGTGIGAGTGTGIVGLPTDYYLGGTLYSYLSTSAGVTVSRALSKRSTISGGVQAYRQGPSTGRTSQTNYGVSARYGYAVSKGFNVRLGYGLQSGQYLINGVMGRLRTHNIDAGVDFNKALSLTRRTTLSFATGSVIVSDGYSSHFDLVGSASLNHRFGRTWNAGLSYVRQVDYVQTVAQPALADSAYATVSGSLTKKLTVFSTTGASRGRVGLTGASNDYTSYSGSAGTNYAWGQAVSINASYIYYRYEFAGALYLPTTVGTHARGQSLRVGVNIVLPLLHRSRRPHAAG